MLLVFLVGQVLGINYYTSFLAFSFCAIHVWSAMNLLTFMVSRLSFKGKARAETIPVTVLSSVNFGQQSAWQPKESKMYADEED